MLPWMESTLNIIVHDSFIILYDSQISERAQMCRGSSGSVCKHIKREVGTSMAFAYLWIVITWGVSQRICFGWSICPQGRVQRYAKGLRIRESDTSGWLGCAVLSCTQHHEHPKKLLHRVCLHEELAIH